MNWLRRHYVELLFVAWVAVLVVSIVVVGNSLGESDIIRKLAGWIQYGLTHIPEPPK